jgi:hypothetical protein
MIKIAVVATVVGIIAMCLVATKPLANQALAAVPCRLTLKADPGSGSLAKGESIEQKLSGTLTCGGTGLGGATITFGGSLPPATGGEERTDSSGNYQGPHFLVHPGDSFFPNAHYAGDSEHSNALAGVRIHIAEKSSGPFTPG